MAKVLLVEDDFELGESLQDWLTREKHVVELVENGKEAFDRLRLYNYDVVILDWELPDMTGLDICRRARDHGVITPMIMLTARAHIADKEIGLDSGVDDYLTKPVEPRELSARLRALMRRPHQVSATILTACDISLDTRTSRVTKGEGEIHLQPKELALLEFLMRNPDQVFSLQDILNRVWSSESDASPEAVREVVKNLRRKIDSDSAQSLIETVHRAGYKLRIART